jgi:hypothetical protein
MVVGFVIWSVVCLILLGIGIWDYNAKDPVSFWTGSMAPEVKDVKKYNHAVGILWIVYAIIFEALGIPLLFLEQNSAGFVPMMFGAIAASIGLMVAYVFVEKKWKK